MKTHTQKVLLLASSLAVAGMFVLPMVVNASSVSEKTELSATQDGSTMVDSLMPAKKKGGKKK